MTCQLCDRPVLARGYCGRHYQKLMRYGNPLEPSHRGENLPMAARGADNSNYRGDRVGYNAAHYRVEVAKGKAAEHACVDCGRQACNWSYNHADPDELYASRNGAPYSVDIDCYEPRCRSCHTKVDHPKNRGQNAVRVARG